MSAGPWEVVDAGDRIIVRNEAINIDLLVENGALDADYERKLAHRIAERLNRTEGDER